MNENYKKITKNGLIYQFQRSGQFPIDQYSVVVSYTDLQETLVTNNSKIYPGMTIAVADDLTENGTAIPDNERIHQGLYIIQNSSPLSSEFTAYKLATSYDLSYITGGTSQNLLMMIEQNKKNIENLNSDLDKVISYQTNPSVKLLTKLYVQDYQICPWDEYTEDGKSDGDIMVTSDDIESLQIDESKLYTANLVVN